MKGILYTLLGTLSLSVMGVAVKILQSQHMTDSLLLMMRFLISFLMLLPLIFLDRQFTFKINGIGLLIVRSLLGLLAMACFFYAISHMPLANAVLLIYTAPVYVPIVVFFFTGIKTTKAVWCGIAISIIGVYCIIDPTADMFLQWQTAIGALAGVLAAGSLVMLRLLTKTNCGTPLLFYYFLFCILFTLPGVIYNWQMPINIQQWLLLLIVGTFGYLFQLFVTMAARVVQIRIIAPVLLVGAVFSAIWDWIFWHDVPNLLAVLGGLILLVGIVIISVYSINAERSH